MKKNFIYIRILIDLQLWIRIRFKIISAGAQHKLILIPQKTGTFALQLMFRGTEDKEGGNTFIQVKAEAIFKFQDNFPFKDLPDFFYKNSIAILFPYLRAFISNMTLQANAPIVILTVMNLGNLEQPLKDATTCIEE